MFPGRRGLPVFRTYDVSTRNDMYKMRKEKMVELLQDVLRVERSNLMEEIKEKQKDKNAEEDFDDEVEGKELQKEGGQGEEMEDKKEERKEEEEGKEGEEEEEEIDILDAVMCKNM